MSRRAMTRMDVPLQPARIARRALFVLILGRALVLATPALAQMTPEEHAKHHPGAGGSTPVPMPPGNSAASGGGMSGMPAQTGTAPPSAGTTPTGMTAPAADAGWGMGAS